MFHYIYKITHKESGKYYIGMRSSEREPGEDPYWGSGKLIRQAVKKYGVEAFQKEIISLHESRNALVLEEKRIITPAIVDDPMSYNIALGGWGGVHTEESKRRISEANTGRPRPDVVERHKTDDSFKYRWRGQSRTDDDKMKKSIAMKSAISEGRHANFGEFTCPH